MIKNELIKSIFYNKIKRDIEEVDFSPERNPIYINASNTIDKIMKLDPNKIEYKSIVSSAGYTDTVTTITSLFASINNISKTFTNDYTILSKKYLIIYEKMRRSLIAYRKKIDIITDRLCISVDNTYKNEQLSSKCGHFGNFLTLPYFINTAKTYTGAVIISVTSDAKIEYSNVGNVTSIPFTNKPSFKLLSTNEKVNTNVKIIIPSNAYSTIYLNIPSDKITKLTVNLNTDTGLITKSFPSGEAFLSFDKSTFSIIELVIESNNYNPGKPYSMLISDLIVFENLEFMNYGIFKSQVLSMDKIKNANGLTIVNQNTNEINTEIIQSLAISNNSDVLSYNRVNDAQFLDMSAYYLSRSKDEILSSNLDQMSIRYNHVINTFFKIPFNSTSKLWNMQFNKANIVVGINVDFMNNSVESDQRYENWKRDGNYYTSYLANFSDNILINLGDKSFILNEKEVTNSVVIPSGISKVKVHEKDITFTLNLGNTGTAIRSDRVLRPGNFAYFFTGLPQYGENDMPILVEKTFSINGQSVLYMNEPFITSGFSVYDNISNEYSFHFGKNVSIAGTFTVEPSKGIVKIFPETKANSVTVRYYKSSQDVAPIGILFGDLLTFAPITTILDPKAGDTIFSIDGTATDRVLYIPRSEMGPGSSAPNFHSQILYNNMNDPLYLSAMVEMQTSSKYVSPAIKSLTISLK